VKKGFIYRAGIAIKDFGERLGHKKIPVLRRWCERVIRLGLAIKDTVSNCPVREM